MKKQLNKSHASLWLTLTMVFTIALLITSCKKDDDKDVDNTAFQTNITKAEGYVSTAVEGNDPGEYVKNSKSVLQAGIDVAKAVLNNSASTQAQISAANTALEDVIYAFEDNEIGDVTLAFGATDSTFAFETSATSAENFNLSVFTFEAWINYSDKPGFHGNIVSTEFYEDGLRGWNLRVGDYDALDFTIADGDESRIQPETGATVPRNTWTHVACSFDGTTMKSYINGVLVGELEASGRDSIFITSTLLKKQQLTFGNSAGFMQPERRLVGEIFDVRFWSVARTAAEIQADKDFILTGTEANLVAYWPFVKSTPLTTIPDKTGDFNLELKNGTVLGTR